MSRQYNIPPNTPMRTVEAILREQGLITSENRLHNRLLQRLYEQPQLIQAIINVTSFMMTAYNIQTRVHCIIQHVTIQPTCKNCNKNLTMCKSGVRVNTFPEFCGASCAAKDNDTKKKRCETNTQKYGVDNLFKLDTIRHNHKGG